MTLPDPDHMLLLPLTPSDFKRLPNDGFAFERLVADLLEAMGHVILEKPATGPDGGRDILIERVTGDAIHSVRERVVVQCKHFAHSGRSVGDADVGQWQNAMNRHQARGFLLVVDTSVTENLGASFRGFASVEMSTGRWAAFWDVQDLIQYLTQHSSVRLQYLPPEGVTSPLGKLAEEAVQWLEAIGYQVQMLTQPGESTIDFLSTIDSGTIRQKVFVRCVGGEVMPTHVAQVLEDRGDVRQCWLITDRRISPRAIKSARDVGDVRVFTLAEFLEELIWQPYVEKLRAMVLSDRIDQLYVDPSCSKHNLDEVGHIAGTDEHESLLSYVYDWLKERGKMHLSVLGDFGAGKTWFCRYFAYLQLIRYLKDPTSERLPILVTLRTFTKTTTPQQLINDTLLEQYGLQFIGSAYSIFQELNKRGKLVLILDGFDEMARQVDYNTLIENFWQLADLVEDESKVILTSRTEYFRWAKESESVLTGRVAGRTRVLMSPAFEIIYLAPFTDEQITRLITARVGGKQGKAMSARLLATPSLRAMLRKPILVELVLSAISEVNLNVLQTPAQVYLYATHKLLLRNIHTERTFTTMKEKLFFLCELAWEMILSGNLRVHYTDFPAFIRDRFADRVQDQHELDVWDYDLRTQTLLHRDAAGYYEFAHKSLAEYFVAYKLAAELGILRNEYRDTYGDGESRTGEDGVYPTREVSGLIPTFGSIQLGDFGYVPVLNFLMEMANERSLSSLYEVISSTKSKTREEVAFLGANAFSLLCPLSGGQLPGYDFSNCVLTGARLGIQSRGVSLRGANFRGAEMYEVSFSGADLRNADLTDAKLSPRSLWAADLRGVTGIGAKDSGLVAGTILYQSELFELPKNERIEAFVQRDEGGVMVVVGPRGAGKTTMVLQAAVRLSHDIPAFYHFGGFSQVRYTGVADWVDGLATFLSLYGRHNLSDFVFGGVIGSSESVHLPTLLTTELMSFALHEHALLIFDDVSGEDTVLAKVLLGIAKTEIKTKVIVTSPHAFRWSGGELNIVVVAPLSPT